MSAPKRTVNFSPRSIRDYDDILLHSLTTWGEEQKNRYRSVLDRTLDELATYPEIGQARNDIGKGYRSRRSGQHVNVYRVDSTSIWVNRILHSRQDIKGELHVPGAN